MKIAINASPLRSPLTGIGQYVLNLAIALRDVEAMRFDYFYEYSWSEAISSAPPSYGYRLKPLVKRIFPLAKPLYRSVQQRMFSAGMRRSRPDLYHEPNFVPYRFDGPTVLTVHDLSWIRFPGTHPPERVRLLDRLLPAGIRQASHLLVDSEFVRNEVIDYYGVPESKVTRVPLAARSIFRPTPPESRRETMAQHGLQECSYFLCVGAFEPRKNVRIALRAHARLPGELRKRYPLVLVGKRGWLSSDLEREAREPLQRGEIALLGYVSESVLADLYGSATALLYPSIYEGFGLPPLEAMACGTPVLLSNASSLPEVGGQAAIMHDPHDVEALSDAMRHLMEDSGFRKDRAAASLQQAQRFSWQETARQTAAVYNAVVNAVTDATWTRPASPGQHPGQHGARH